MYRTSCLHPFLTFLIIIKFWISSRPIFFYLCITLLFHFQVALLLNLWIAFLYNLRIPIFLILILLLFRLNLKIYLILCLEISYWIQKYCTILFLNPIHFILIILLLLLQGLTYNHFFHLVKFYIFFIFRSLNAYIIIPC